MPDEKDSRRLPTVILLSAGAVGILATGVILRSAESVLAPMTLALVTGIVLSPLAVSWERVGIPHKFGAILNLVVALCAIGGSIFLLQPVAMRMIDQAPKVVADVESTVRELREMVSGLDEMSQEVADAMQGKEDEDAEEPLDMTEVNTPVPESGPAADPEDDPEAEEDSSDEEDIAESAPVPSVTDVVWLAPSILAQVAIFAGTLFFFLATRVETYRWIARHIPWNVDRSLMLQRLLEAEKRVSRYFLTVAVINAGLGLAVFGAMTQLGVTGAPVWGLVAFLCNFVLYLGPAAFFVAMLYAGIASFDGIQALLPAACYIGLNFIEAQFVTPTAVGKQLSLNPLVVFLSVVLGIFIWGAIGGIVAIPILVWILVINDFTGIASNETKAA
ncbi:AI-2E family transporter [Psychromarinibacter halotolerans]|uniref:AI-2E family transporter n=1 Tax=Psychromarinibacter halotolerans TaxID=1775175 RepID=A0ABV7GK13_9RHOB|nr:AI-2E family transporter [Psychromarinibacter halotolerans]MDF0595628.1 AI-2E family transporter [Psychromarinibacter halotolerans]